MLQHHVYDLRIKGEKRDHPFYLFGPNRVKVTKYLSSWVKRDLRKGKAKLVRVE